MSKNIPSNGDPHIVCCIYHKPKRFDESSDEDSDSSDDEHPSHRHGKACSHGHGHSTGERDSDDSSVVVHEERPEPNAYEVDPSKKGKGRA